MPDQPRRRRHHLRQAAEEKADGLHEDDAQAEGDEHLVLVWPGVERADDDPLRYHPDEHDEQRAGDDCDDEGARVSVCHPAGVTAEHEHGAVREVEHAERAIDDRQAGRDQRQQRAEHQPIEALRYKIRPVDHASVRNSCLGAISVKPAGFAPGNMLRQRRHGGCRAPRHDGIKAFSASPIRRRRMAAVRRSRRACSRTHRVSASAARLERPR